MAKKGDFTLHNYQDDIDTDPNQTDPVMNEQTENFPEELGIPADEFKDELDTLDPESSDDARESVEDTDDEQGRRNNE